MTDLDSGRVEHAHAPDESVGKFGFLCGRGCPSVLGRAALWSVRLAHFILFREDLQLEATAWREVSIPFEGFEARDFAERTRALDTLAAQQNLARRFVLFTIYHQQRQHQDHRRAQERDELGPEAVMLAPGQIQDLLLEDGIDQVVVGIGSRALRVCDDISLQLDAAIESAEDLLHLAQLFAAERTLREFLRRRLFTHCKITTN